MQAKLVWYVELRGEHAYAELQAFLATLDKQPGFVSSQLLSSPVQAGLMLAVSRWANRIPQLTIPAGARDWVFEVVAGE